MPWWLVIMIVVIAVAAVVFVVLNWSDIRANVTRPLTEVNYADLFVAVVVGS